jgi:hypothetical protein
VSEPILDERQALINLSAALGSRDALAVRTALAVARPLADHVRVEEAILQAYLFVGFPVVLSALAAWREAGRTARTVGAEQVGELEDWSERTGKCSVVRNWMYRIASCVSSPCWRRQATSRNCTRICAGH